jgi:hypothetical protein
MVHGAWSCSLYRCTITYCDRNFHSFLYRSLQDAADNETDSYMHVHVARIQKEITNSKTVGYPREVFDPTLIEIRRLYDSSGQMFVDSDFPPVEVSLYKVASGSSNATTSTAKAVKHPPIEWKRAHEFLVTGSVTACKVFEGCLQPFL